MNGGMNGYNSDLTRSNAPPTGRKQPLAKLAALAARAVLVFFLLHLSRSIGTRRRWFHRVLSLNHDATSAKQLLTKAAEIFGPHERCAYAFVIGGVNPERPNHRGYIYNILVSARVLRESGSQLDIVVLFQVSSKTKATTISEEEQQWLDAVGVRVQYIEKNPNENFMEITMAKFHILNMTEYQRVLFLDGDVTPLGNLDYFFRLSLDGTLKKNIIVAGKRIAACAGFFMLTPRLGDLDRFDEIVRQREAKAIEKGVTFDEEYGYGHKITPPDYWETRTGKKSLKYFPKIYLLWSCHRPGHPISLDQVRKEERQHYSSRGTGRELRLNGEWDIRP